MNDSSVTKMEDFLSSLLGEIGVELAEMIQEIVDKEESDYKTFDKTTEFQKSQAFTLILCCMGITFGIFIFILCDGLIRFIYLMKCLMLIIPSIVACFFHWNIALQQGENMFNVIKSEAKTNITEPLSTDDTNLATEKNSHIEIWNFMISVFPVLDEILSLTYIHELYLLVSSLRVKKQNSKKWILKVGLGVLVSVTSSGLQILTVFIHSYSWRMVVISITPLHSLISLGVTVGTCYFGWATISILTENHNFQKQHSSTAVFKTSYAVVLIITNIVFQFMKLSTRTALTVVQVFDTKDLECTYHFIDFENLMDLLLFMHKCLKYTQFSWKDAIIDIIEKPIWSVLEFVCVLLIIGVKKVLSHPR